MEAECEDLAEDAAQAEEEGGGQAVHQHALQPPCSARGRVTKQKKISSNNLLIYRCAPEMYGLSRDASKNAPRFVNNNPRKTKFVHN